MSNFIRPNDSVRSDIALALPERLQHPPYLVRDERLFQHGPLDPVEEAARLFAERVAGDERGAAAESRAVLLHPGEQGGSVQIRHMQVAEDRVVFLAGEEGL